MFRRSVLLVALAACGHGAAPAHRSAAPAPPPRARPVEAPSVLTPDEVLSAVTSRYLPGLRRCYQLQIKRDARARGHAMLAFTVDDTGRVTEATARGKLAPRLGECIERRMLAWTFAKATGEASFRIPVRLDTL